MGVAILHYTGGGGINADGATIKADQVRSGKYFGMNGEDDPALGSLVDRSFTTNVKLNETVTIPRGIYNGTSAKFTQSITNKGAWTATIGPNGSVTVPAGYHNGQGYVESKVTTKGATTLIPSGTADQSIPANTYMTGKVQIAAESNFKAENIKKGVKIFGVTGTREDYAPTQLSWM